MADKRILKEHLQAILGKCTSIKKATPLTEPERTLSLKEYKRQTEREYIQSILALANGSVTKAAQLLDIDRTYLHQKMVSHNLKS